MSPCGEGTEEGGGPRPQPGGLASATELRRRHVAGETSAAESVEEALSRIERYNPLINAVVAVSDTALDDARALDAARAAGEPPGPLHGVPVGIKDVTPVAGLRTTYGSPLHASDVPDHDSLLVRRLREAGAVILGKTNTPEFATGGNTVNEVFGATRNPWDPARTAGGSTGGGAAALATGMIALAEGTDLGGSLRMPASFCGVVGLRPSVGLVPTIPTALHWDTLAVSGPMARTAEDVALLLQVLAGPAPESPLRRSTEGRDFAAAVRDAIAAGAPTGMRLAYCTDLSGIGIDRGVEATCRGAAEALARSGASVDEVVFDTAGARHAFLALRGQWMVSHHLERVDRLNELGDNLVGNIRRGLRTTAVEIAKAERVRTRLAGTFADLFERYDLLLTSCMAVPPFPVEQSFPEMVAGRRMETYVDWFAPTFVVSLTGLPAASVPAGLDPDGLPVGLQVVGPPDGEERVLALAGLLQALRPIGAPPGV